MNIEELPLQARVFLDANIFLYHSADASPDCSRLLGLVEWGRLAGFTSPLVLEEVLFRRLVAEAVVNFGWSPRSAVDNLRQRPEVVKGLLTPWEEVRSFSSIVRVMEPGLSDLLKSQEVQERFGLFGHDAINAQLIRKASIPYVATADRDFDRLDFTIRIEIAIP